MSVKRTKDLSTAAENQMEGTTMYSDRLNGRAIRIGEELMEIGNGEVPHGSRISNCMVVRRTKKLSRGARN
jgi:hypothetical protein